ncbi:putative sphingolipid transporter spinster-like protein 2 [Diplonema papillatum]|nr:putative sphingolipid transporter spinster-like protein 2 [Diplonema papillatum]
MGEADNADVVDDLKDEEQGVELRCFPSRKGKRGSKPNRRRSRKRQRLSDEELLAFPTVHRRWVCFLILLTRIAAHYDEGALAALIGDKMNRMSDEMDMSRTEQGLLVSLGYFGLFVGSLVSGTLLQKFEAKRLIQGSLVMLSFAIVAFSCSPNSLILQLTRPLIGFSQALLTVFFPIWADEYAPPQSSSAYMSALQAGGPLGVVVGFVTSGFLMANGDFSWRWCFVFQGILLAPCIVFYFAVPATYIDLRPKKGDEPVDMKAGLSRVLSDPLVWSATLTVSSLYFVVTGLQIWVAEYAVEDEAPLHADPNTVVASFGFTAATAPVIGIITGGVILSKCGGYRGHHFKTASIVFALGIFAAVFSWGAMLATSINTFMITVWLLLFFGGSMIPGLVGLTVISVPKPYRGISLGFATVVQNLLGYSLGPLAAGVVADNYGIVWGMRLILAWSLVAVLFQCMVMVAAWVRDKSGVVLSPVTSELDTTNKFLFDAALETPTIMFQTPPLSPLDATDDEDEDYNEGAEEYEETDDDSADSHDAECSV